jgi:hypothetical protein
MTHRIEPGQEYLACRPTPSMPGEHYTRIRVVTTPGLGFHKAEIVTVWPDGTTSNPRRIEVRSLHPTGFRRDGHPRVAGYRLVTHADGTPAGQGGAR